MSDLAAMQKIVKSDASKHMLSVAIEKDTAKDIQAANIEIYKRLRDGDLATADNAREFIKNIFLQSDMTCLLSAVSVSTSDSKKTWATKSLHDARFQ